MKYLFLLLSILLVISCKNNTEPEPESDKYYKIKFNKTIELKNTGIKIEFLDVLEDSRCPQDVICCWAGNANVLIKIADSTFSFNSIFSPQSFSYKNYNIVFAKLFPYPHSQKIINKKDYIVSLDIKEIQ